MSDIEYSVIKSDVIKSFDCNKIAAVDWPQRYETFFMLNSAEHEIYPVNNW